MPELTQHVESRTWKHGSTDPAIQLFTVNSWIGNYKILNHNKIFLSLSLVDQFIDVILKSEDHIKVKKFHLYLHQNLWSRTGVLLYQQVEQ